MKDQILICLFFIAAITSLDELALAEAYIKEDIEILGNFMKVLDDIKSGRLVNAGATGGQAAVQQQTPKKPVVKRVYDAVPEDVKAIAAGWR